MSAPFYVQSKLFPASCFLLFCPAPLYCLGDPLAPFRRKVPLFLGYLLGCRCSGLAGFCSSAAEQGASLL